MGQLLLFRGREGLRVQLHTEVIGHGHDGAEGKAVPPPRLMVGAGRDMGTDQFGRQKAGNTVLDVETIKRIGAVRRPDPMGAGENAEIDPATAGRAALNLDIWDGRRGSDPSGHRRPVFGRR